MFSEKELVFLNNELVKFNQKVEQRLSDEDISEPERTKFENLLVTSSSIRRKLEHDKRTKSQKTKESPSILVIDDITSALQINKQFLHSVGFKKIDTASDGRQGFKKLKGAAAINKPFGLVVCDWEMPNMSGLELLEQVRKDEELWATPFYLLSSRSQRKDIIEAINIGATGYVTKPVNQAIVEETFKDYIVV